MSDWERTVIPLDTATEILSAFGVGPDSEEYQRWCRDDGFRQVDFEEVLNTSPFVLGVDWREWLQDAMDTIVDQLSALGITLTADLGEEGEQGTIEVDGRTEDVKYVRNDEDDFDDVVLAVNRLVRPHAHYRKLQSREGSDGWWYALLRKEDWDRLEENAPDTLSLLFSRWA
jgi:hypothetical protein